jgi:hypothetical protein
MPHHRARGVEAGFAQTREQLLAIIPPCHRLREPVDLIQVEAERLADVAQRRARPIADHRRGQRCAFATVLFVDVLDHLLAPLMLEIDVDVRRLVALARDEALEQHFHA